MVEYSKIVFAGMLVISQIGLGIVAFNARDYKTAILGVLFGICNILIFLVK